MPRLVDVMGKKFGRLTAIERVENSRNGASRWRCMCDCGKESIVRGSFLSSGHTTSCGCFYEEKIILHRKTETPEWKAWNNMIQRCQNPKNKSYPHYGGRGITVCARWLDSFVNFYADMGPKPTPAHSIERKENDGNYNPSNCCWTTQSEQLKNQRRSIKNKK